VNRRGEPGEEWVEPPRSSGPLAHGAGGPHFGPGWDNRPVGGELDDLQTVLAGFEGAVVAFSGGTDSTLVAAVAVRTLDRRTLAATAVSLSLAPGELSRARSVASEVGIRHRAVRTRETENDSYLSNGWDRCYHCRVEVYGALRKSAAEEGLPDVLSGTHLDDLADFRPGLRAAREVGVRHPLVEAGFTKADVRRAAATLGLSVADKPSSACLSSRIAFGTRITVEELTRIGRAECVLRDLGFTQVRVRVHGEIARIEVAPTELERLAEPGIRSVAVHELELLGYRYVTLDLEGFRSGSMNPPEEVL